MNGLLGSDGAATVGMWVAALVTIAVWSYLAGERRLFGLLQHLLAGLATGYLVIVSVRDVLVPRLVVPLAANPAGHLHLWVAAGLGGVLLLGAWLPRRLGAIPIAVVLGGTAAFALGGAVVGTLMPQLASGIAGRGDAGILLNGGIGLAISILVLLAFLHGTPRQQAVAGAAAVGRWLLIGGVGGWLGFLVVSRLSLVVDRLTFLLGDWLGVVR